MHTETFFAMGGGFMWIFWLLIAVVIVYFLKESLFNDVQVSSLNHSALEILESRYAKGEIKLEEYQEMKKNLQT